MPTTTQAGGVGSGNNRNNNDDPLNGSGGGSPFDFVGAGNSIAQSSSLGALIVAIWALMLVAQ